MEILGVKGQHLLNEPLVAVRVGVFKRPHGCPLLSLLVWVQPQLIIKLVIQGGVLGERHLGFLGNLTAPKM